MIEDTPEIAALRKAILKAMEARQTIEYACKVERGEAVRQIDEAIAVKYATRYSVAFSAEHEAQKALDDAIVAHSLASNRLTGEILCGWERVVPLSSREYRRTGQRGRLEVRTPESAFANNYRNIGLPAPGEVFLRVLKKDGSPSTRFEKHRGGPDKYGRYYWLPEGKEPKL